MSDVGTDGVAQLDPLAGQLAATAEWLLVREGAIDGLRAKVALEERAMEIDHKLGREDWVAVRLAKLDQLQRAIKRATDWRPLVELPMRRRP